MRTPHPLALASASALLAFSALAPGAGAQPDAARPDTPAERRPPRDDTPEPRHRSPSDPADLRRLLEEARAEVGAPQHALMGLEPGGHPDAPGNAQPRNPRDRGGAHEGRRHEGRPNDAHALPGSDGPGAPPRRPPPALLPPEAEARVMDFLREHHHAAAAKAEALRHRRPMIARRMLAELGGQMRELGAIREKDPKMFDVRLRAFRLDWEMREAAFEYLRATRPGALASPGGAEDPGPVTDPAALRKRLAKLADDRFGVMLEERSLQIEHMGVRIEQLRKELDNSEKNREQAVRERVDAMLERLDRRDPPGAPGAPDPEEGPGRGPRPGADRPPRGDRRE